MCPTGDSMRSSPPQDLAKVVFFYQNLNLLISSLLSSPSLSSYCVSSKTVERLSVQVTDMKQLRKERCTVDEDSELELPQYLGSTLSFK